MSVKNLRIPEYHLDPQPKCHENYEYQLFYSFSSAEMLDNGKNWYFCPHFSNQLKRERGIHIVSSFCKTLSKLFSIVQCSEITFGVDGNLYHANHEY